MGRPALVGQGKEASPSAFSTEQVEGQVWAHCLAPSQLQKEQLGGWRADPSVVENAGHWCYRGFTSNGDIFQWLEHSHGEGTGLCQWLECWCVSVW